MKSIEVHYELSGPPDAPVVVLSGPLGSSLEVWEPLVERLTERFRVLRYDHRGHGRSPWQGSYVPDDGPVEVASAPYGSYTIVNMAFDVVALLDRLGIERVIFCGVELGGLVGIWLATHLPERLSSLVLSSTSASYGVNNTWNDLAWIAGLAGGTKGVADDVVGKWFSAEWAAAHPEAVEQAKQMVADTDKDGFADCCIALAAWEATKLVRRIPTSTLVIATVPEAGKSADRHTKSLGGAIPGAKLKYLQGGALGVVEQAEQATFLISIHTKKAR